MTSQDVPLVTVLTPVYNGEKYLKECIESVLAQSFRNWEYIIINNCSTDQTLAIATAYAKEDSRICVVTNEQFVGVIENHNIAFSYVPDSSKYCKVVSADDRIAPKYLERMIDLAEAHPSTAIVGCYQQCRTQVLWKGLPADQAVFSGKDVCRSTLLNGLDVFGTPTSLLFRSSLVRSHTPFLPHTRPHADTSACFHYLNKHDLGFVHDVLCEHRVHEGQASTAVIALGAGYVACIEHLLTYGPIYLNAEEFEDRSRLLFEEYYKWLGGNILKLKGVKFWQYHASRLKQLGHPIPWGKVIRAMVFEILTELKQPDKAMGKVIRVMKGAI